jgi:DnaJ-domain-containing protein 1
MDQCNVARQAALHHRQRDRAPSDDAIDRDSDDEHAGVGSVDRASPRPAGGLARRRAARRCDGGSKAGAPVIDVCNPMIQVTLYDILEVSPKARPAVIRAAYRCLVQQYHPDRNADDPRAAEQMYRINQAYSVLADPLQRARYDETMGAGAVDRRGTGRAPRAANPAAGGDRATVRRFAFRPID